MLQFFKKKVSQYFINNLSIPNFEKSLERLKQMGYSPACIFDVGAYKGDFSKMCLELWPKTNAVCFEPLQAQYKILSAWEKTEPRVKVIHGLLGDEINSSVKFNESETASSVLDEHANHGFATSYLPMRTLDSCIDEFKLSTPSLVKIDTQGYEFQILRGFLKNLQRTDVVIAELNHIDIHKNVHLAEEVIALLYQNGFVIYDIVEIHRRPFDKAIWQTDFMFVKKDSVWRQNKSWS